MALVRYLSIETKNSLTKTSWVAQRSGAKLLARIG